MVDGSEVPEVGGPGTGGPGTGGADRAGRRRPHSVYDVGSEPDPRFSMANERTALAWVRTGLAFIAGGIALTSVSAVTPLPEWVDVTAVLASLIGAGTATNAVLSWRSNERALRLGEPLPAPRVLPWLVGAVLVAAVVIVGIALGQI